MMERGDLERLLAEMHGPWEKSEEGEEVTDWLRKNEISEEVWETVGRSIWFISGQDAFAHLKDGNLDESVRAYIAGIQLAFFVGWESAKQYSK